MLYTSTYMVRNIPCEVSSQDRLAIELRLMTKLQPRNLQITEQILHYLINDLSPLNVRTYYHCKQGSGVSPTSYKIHRIRQANS